MGEEEKKVEQVKGKKDGGGAEGEKKEGGKEEKKAAAAPPPPEEIEMRVFMHCEGCARKVKRILKGFDGVEYVMADCRTHKVVVKGKKAAEDPMKVVQRVEKKTGRKVELLTPLPQAKPEKKENEQKKEEKPKAEEKKEEPQVIEVVLKVHMPCDACAQAIRKRILRMKGVEVVEPNLKSSQVTVKGMFDPEKLVEDVYKSTGKLVEVAQQEQEEKKKPDGEKGGGGKDAAKEEKAENNAVKKEEKDGGGGEASVGDEKAKKDNGGAAEEGADTMKNEFYQCYPRYPVGGYGGYGGYVGYAYTPYHPQIFSDENPNATCSVM